MATSHYFIGGGAEHTAEMVRRHTYATNKGAEGICEFKDLQVLPYEIPGEGVRVTIGSGYVTSRYAGAVREMYMGSVTEQEIVPIERNETGSARYDLVIMRIRDPYVQGSPWPDPGAGAATPEEADQLRANAKYTYIEVISGVPSSTRRLQDIAAYRNETAITLARVIVRARTGTIQKTDITYLADVAIPRRHEVLFARPRVSADDSPTQNWLRTRTSDGGEYFPGGGGYANEFQAEVPEWATRVLISGTFISVRYQGGKNVWGRYWMEFGDEYRPKTWPGKKQFEFATQHFQFDASEQGGTNRLDWRFADNCQVAQKLRGKLATFVFKGGLGNTSTSGSFPTDGVSMDFVSGLEARLVFVETPLGWEDAI